MTSSPDYVRLHVDYRRLRVSREWDGVLLAEYLRRERNGISLRQQLDLAFLADVPGLLSFFVMDPLRDDSGVYGAATLEDLVLLDRCRKPCDFSGLPRLRALQMDYRPGLGSLAGHPSLESAAVFGFAEGECPWGDRPPVAVKSLALHGKRQPFSLRREQLGEELRELALSNMQLGSDALGALAGMPELQQVELDLKETNLDLAPLLDCPNLRRVYVGGRNAVASLQPVRGHPLLDYVECPPRAVADGKQWR